MEVRIPDLPTDVRRIGALAAIVQALVATYQDRFRAGAPRTDVKREYLEQNHWQAMRRGLAGKIIEPVRYRPDDSGLKLESYVERLKTFPESIEPTGEDAVFAMYKMKSGAMVQFTYAGAGRGSAAWRGQAS